MRLALPVAALVLALAFAGCSGQGGPAPASGEDDGAEGRRSVGGGPGGNKTRMEEVPFFEGAIRLVGPGDASYAVEVPANLTAVEARIASPGAAYQEGGLGMDLTGCGGFTELAFSTAGSFGGPTSRTYVVCAVAAPGPQTFTVHSGGASLIDGTLRLVGLRPAANQTAAP